MIEGREGWEKAYVGKGIYGKRHTWEKAYLVKGIPYIMKKTYQYLDFATPVKI